jgi:tetratricopeptide (TPR) repeat protein
MIRVLLLLACSARAQILPAVIDHLEKPTQLYEAGRYADVVKALTTDKPVKMRRQEAAKATLLLAKSHEQLHRLDRALSVYQLGIKLYPKHVPLLEGLAELYHVSNLEEQAQPLFQKVLELEPRNIRAHVGLAQIDRALGFLDRSADHYEIALEEDAGNNDLWRSYAEVLMEQRDFLTAELAIEKSLAINPNSIDSLLVSAFIKRAAGKLPEALKVLDTVIETTGGQPDLSLTRSLWLIESGDLKGAKAQAEAVLKEDPAEPLAHFILGRLAITSGEKDKALLQLKAAAKAPEGSFVNLAAKRLLESL